MANPTVSIIMPTYNHAQYLPRSIESVLAQTYTDWELIIWNDGSTDQTDSIIRPYLEHRIRCYKDVNRGAAYARNQAMTLSKGDYVAFLDSDDEWLPEKLAYQVKVLEKYPEIDLIFGDFENVNLATGQVGLGFQQNIYGLSFVQYQKVAEKLFIINDNFLVGLARSNFLATDSILFRRWVIEKTGDFNTGLRNGEDFELWWRMGLSGVQFAFTDQVLLRRIKPPGSLSSPSITAYENALLTLESCFHETEVRQQVSLLPLFQQPYRSAWQGLIRQYALMGDRKMAIHAFRNSMRYGFSWRSLYLLLGALVGPQVISRVRREK